MAAKPQPMNNVTSMTTPVPHWMGLEAPRYTSYPTAHHFTPQVGEAQHRIWLHTVGEGADVSVYVHVPFCKELCWFCGCHTKMTKRYEPIKQYVQLLLREIEMLRQHLSGRGRLASIHFGGGSPSLLEPGDVMAILYAIRSVFPEGTLREQAIELDPRTTSAENIAHYRDMGFNRISIGLQDFDPTVQQAINRIQPYEMVATVMEQLRAAGLSHINCDLIYGLPHQTRERFLDSLAKTVQLAPDRIALFSYAHVPHIKKHQRLIPTEWLPSDDAKLALFLEGAEFLESQGYVTIGIDHFARSDDPLAVAMRDRTLARNFQGYVTDTTDVLIGVGSSSISQFPQGFMQNSAHMPDYRAAIEGGHLPSLRGWAFVGDDTARKRVIDALMCFMEVDLAQIRQAFELPEYYFQPELDELAQGALRHVVAIQGERLRIATPYRMAARVVATVFDGYRHVMAGRYSKVV